MMNDIRHSKPFWPQLVETFLAVMRGTFTEQVRHYRRPPSSESEHAPEHPPSAAPPDASLKLQEIKQERRRLAREADALSKERRKLAKEANKLSKENEAHGL